MAAYPVGMPLALRPWAQNGVGFLLAPEALPAPYSLTLPTQPERPGPRTKTTTAARQRITHRPNPSTQPAAPSVKVSGADTYDHKMAAAGGDNNLSAPLTPAQAAAAARLAAHEWPAPWQKILARAKPGKVLWSYKSLGDDLGGTPDVQRRSLLNRLLRDLALPAGSSTFWPCTLPECCGGAHDAQIFWEGVRALRARVVILMGYNALLATGMPSNTGLWSQLRYRGCLVYVVPDVTLLVREGQRYGPTLEFLRSNLQPLMR